MALATAASTFKTYDAPPPFKPNGAAAPSGTEASSTGGFFATVRGWFGRIFSKVRSFFTKAASVVKTAVVKVATVVKSRSTGLTARLPEKVVRLARPFALLPLAVPAVWNLIGKAATWLWNHGPRQTYNWVAKRVWGPIQRRFDMLAERFTSSRVRAFVRFLPSLIQTGLMWAARKVAGRFGLPGMVGYGLLVAFTTPTLGYFSDFTDGNKTGQTVMASASLATIATLFVAGLYGKSWSLVKAGGVLVNVGAWGGYAQEAVMEYVAENWGAEAARIQAEHAEADARFEAQATPAPIVVQATAATVQAEAQDLIDDITRPSLVKSKMNPRPRGKREVWVVEGHDVDLEQVVGFYWRDGVGYDKEGAPIAVDLRGELTRATRDRRRAEFGQAWATAHLA